MEIHHQRHGSAITHQHDDSGDTIVPRHASRAEGQNLADLGRETILVEADGKIGIGQGGDDDGGGTFGLLACVSATDSATSPRA
jgi:hypothetical protein